MKFKSFVGIDISKESFDASFLDSQGKLVCHRKFVNNHSGFKQFSIWVKTQDQFKDLLICLEHTGIYGLPICVYLEEVGLQYSLQPGLQIKRSMGIQRGKNDKVDAFQIGRYAYLNRSDISCYKLPSKSILEMKQLLSYRERLVKCKVALRTAAKELGSFTDKEISMDVCNDSSVHVTALVKSIKELDKKLLDLIKQDKELHELFQLISTVKGIGLQIAANVLVSTHGFVKFSNWRKFSCYCGLAPFEHSSGSSIRGKTRVSHLGNKKLKSLIGNGISSAIQHDPELNRYYHRKLQEGKHKMVVMNAIKNKLISRMFAVVKRRTPFVPLFQYS